MIRIEQRLRALDTEGFGLIDLSATTVVAAAWVSLGVLIAQDGTERR